MAVYIFRTLTTLLAKGDIDLADARVDASTIAHDDATHAAFTYGVFRACLIQPSSTLIASNSTNTGSVQSVDVTHCGGFTTLNELSVGGYTPMASGDEGDNKFTTTTLEYVAGPAGYVKWTPPAMTISDLAAGQDINGVLLVWDQVSNSNTMSTKIPLMWIGLTDDISTNGGNVAITWPATGMLRVQG